jgi:uncharacterized membrane protein
MLDTLLQSNTPRTLRRRIRPALFAAEAAIIAALYVALTYLASAMGLASMAIQLRFSEALCMLTVLTPAAVPGMWIGCFLANLLTGAVAWDIVFGSLATLLGVLGGRALVLAARRLYPAHPVAAKVTLCLTPLPTVVANAAIIPPVLIYAYGVGDALPYLILTVGLGEILSAWGLGLLLLLPMARLRRRAR